jgi:hypothetical protein
LLRRHQFLHANGLFDRWLSAEFTRGQLTVSFEDQAKGLLEVTARRGQGATLGVHARDFFYIGHVPAPALLDNSGEGLTDASFSPHSEAILAYS